jgi:hypothetical protein
MILETHRGNLTYWFVPLGQTEPEQALSPIEGAQAPRRGRQGPLHAQPAMVHGQHAQLAGRQADPDGKIELKRLTIASVPEALAILAPLAVDSLAMPGLRQMANSLGLSKLNNRKNSEVLTYLALQLATQRVYVTRRIVLSTGTSSEETRQGTQLKPSGGGPAGSTKSNEPDPSTFGPDAMQDQQAAALIAASADGVPFCEECARAAAAGKAGQAT